MTSSDWLPALILFEDFGGNWEEYEKAIYDYFRQDFCDSSPSYPGKRFAIRKNPFEKGKEAAFWHLISEGTRESERIPDFRRCERIRWPRPIIEALNKKGLVNCWKSRRPGHRRILVGLLDFSYVVVLEDRAEYVLLIAAYCVEQPHRQMKLTREYERSEKMTPPLLEE
jgi:hypothetical protein